MDTPCLMTEARKRMMFEDQTWFASLACRLTMVPTEPSPSCPVKPRDHGRDGCTCPVPTAEVDGVSLAYNTAFIGALSKRERQCVVTHVTFHCACLHPYHRGERDETLWNEATDYFVNNELAKNIVDDKGAIVTPGWEAEIRALGGLLDSRFDGMSSETIYAILEKERDEQTQQNGGMPPPRPSRGAFGDVTDGKPEMPDEEPGDQPGGGAGGPGGAPRDTNGISHMETSWAVAVQQATNVAAKNGQLPESAARTAKLDVRATDWRPIVASLFTVPGESSWTKPDRRFVYLGLYLPGLSVDRLRRLEIVVDTSGSIDGPLFSMFGGELAAILDSAGWPEEVRVSYVDDCLRGEHVLEQGVIGFQPVGGGGTTFRPVFDRIRETGDEPDVLIYFTDLIGDAETIEPPSFPVVWATPRHSTRVAPFGETVRL